MSTDSKEFVELQKRAHQQLLEAVQQFDESAHWAGCVKCGTVPLRAVCGDVWVNDEQTIVSLNIVLILDPDSEAGIAQRIGIAERVAGFGENLDSALNSAALTWAISAFVAGAALYAPDEHPGHMASVTERTFVDGEDRNRRWKIASSPSTQLVWGGVSEGETAPQPPDTRTTLEPLFAQLALESKMQWVKVFLARTDGEISIDCSLNSEKSPQVNQLFEDFDWPPDGENLMIRQFHIMQPMDKFVA